jgi:hypothetical protein
MNGCAPREVHVRVSGPFDAIARRRLDRTVAGWCLSTMQSDVAHIDLSEATALDSDGAVFLAAIHRRLAGAGWQFRITPPEDPGARTAFVRAAIHGVFGWAAPMHRPAEGLGDDETA